MDRGRVANGKEGLVYEIETHPEMERIKKILN